MNSPSPAPTESFRLEWYKLHRQHEFELLKATVAYEHERLKLLAYLNGGAAAAFLPLLSTSDRDLGTVMPYAAIAMLLWSGGLLLAWWGWSWAHDGQSYVTRAYRMRRYIQELPHGSVAEFGIEAHRFNAKPSSAEVAVTPNELALSADEWRQHSRDTNRDAWRIASASALAFVFGAGLSAYAMYAASKTPPSEKPVLALVRDESGKYSFEAIDGSLAAKAQERAVPPAPAPSDVRATSIEVAAWESACVATAPDGR